MKKKYLCLAAAGMCLFSACSNDDDVIANGNNTSSSDFEGQELVMRVANGGDGLTTRAGRPLYSSEAGQSIDKVKLAIFKLGEEDAIESCVFVKEFTDWSNTGSDSYGGNITNGSVDHGRYKSLNLKKEINENEDNKGLDPGTYMVYAVGYTSTGSVYTYTPALTEIVADWSSASTFESVKATSSSNGEEIFAGSIAKITVDGSRNFIVVEGDADNNILYLHRQVAGAFGYFKNIPVAGPDGTAATNLRLVASGKHNVLNMTKFNTDFRTTGDDVVYVVNGEDASEGAPTADAKFKDGKNAYCVYDIQLNKWFTGDKMDKNGDGILNEKDAEDNWNIPSEITSQGDFNAISGTVFGSNFVIPFANNGSKTFELQLTNGTGADAKILRTWTINLKEAQTGVVDVEGTSIDNESISVYSIVRNHLYSIGNKNIADPENPGEEPGETPEDLNKGQILTLRVNDNWEVIHNMDIEPEV